MNIIDVATSAMRATNKAVALLSNINLLEMPSVARTPLDNLTIIPPAGTFTSIIQFHHPGKQYSKGVIVVYVSPVNVEILFGANFGLSKKSSQAEIRDACGEFCNVVAGGFKKEVAELGYGEILITTPKNHYIPAEEYFQASVSEQMDFAVAHKYKIRFSHKENELVELDVAMESST